MGKINIPFCKMFQRREIAVFVFLNTRHCIQIISMATMVLTRHRTHAKLEKVQPVTFKDIHHLLNIIYYS